MSACTLYTVLAYTHSPPPPSHFLSPPPPPPPPQKVQERWYESLHDWEAAYKAYQERQKQRPDDISLTLGKMRCLHAMGEW